MMSSQKGHSACPVHIVTVKDLPQCGPEQAASSKASSEISLAKLCNSSVERSNSFASNSVSAFIMVFLSEFVWS
jgi:hypothetical protein